MAEEEGLKSHPAVEKEVQMSRRTGAAAAEGLDGIVLRSQAADQPLRFHRRGHRGGATRTRKSQLAALRRVPWKRSWAGRARSWPSRHGCTKSSLFSDAISAKPDITFAHKGFTQNAQNGQIRVFAEPASGNPHDRCL